ENRGIFAHRGPHFSLRQPVWAGKIKLEGIDAGILAALDDFDPRAPPVLLHDRGDQDTLGEGVLAPLEFIEPNREWSVADQFNVLPTEHLILIIGQKLGIAGRNI